MVYFVLSREFSCFVTVVVGELPELIVVINLELVHPVEVVLPNLLSLLLLLDF